MKSLGVAATFIGTVALILGFVGIVIPYWEHNRSFAVEGHSCLCALCEEKNPDLQTDKICLARDDRLSKDYMKAVRALEILGIVLLGFSQLSAVLKLTVKKDLLVLFQISGGLAIFSGIFTITSMVLYRMKNEDEVDLDVLFHVGYGLCVTSGCLSILSGALLL